MPLTPLAVAAAVPTARTVPLHISAVHPHASILPRAAQSWGHSMLGLEGTSKPPQPHPRQWAACPPPVQAARGLQSTPPPAPHPQDCAGHPLPFQLRGAAPSRSALAAAGEGITHGWDGGVSAARLWLFLNESWEGASPERLRPRMVCRDSWREGMCLWGCDGWWWLRGPGTPTQGRGVDVGRKSLEAVPRQLPASGCYWCTHGFLLPLPAPGLGGIRVGTDGALGTWHPSGCGTRLWDAQCGVPGPEAAPSPPTSHPKSELLRTAISFAGAGSELGAPRDTNKGFVEMEKGSSMGFLSPQPHVPATFSSSQPAHHGLPQLPAGAHQLPCLE